MKSLVMAIALGAACPAHALEWTVDPAHIPWETLSTVPDSARRPATTYPEVAERMDAIQETLRDGTLTREARAAALVEMADLFRDEARLVVEAEFLDEPRILMPTSPAWLQLELAVKWYDEARAEDPVSSDPDGRLTLLLAVTRARLLEEQDSFASYATVIREYRRSPYADIAKLAVGDHHFLHGDIDRARSAYKLVRNHQVPELAAYARYRLAHVEAAEDDVGRAIAMLEPLMDDAGDTPLTKMVADASRFSLANLLAPRLTLEELLTWSNAACADATPRCADELREASSDGFESAGFDNEAAWVRTVDAALPTWTTSVERIRLSRLAALDVDPVQTLEELEGVCPQDGDVCRAELAHAAADFYDEAGRQEGGWLREYEKLPKFLGRPDLDRALGEVARLDLDGPTALAKLYALCDDQETRDKARLHLLRYYQTTWRAHDARWIRWTASPPRLPGVPDDVVAALVRDHVPAADALVAVRAHCDGGACDAAVIEPLAAYYHDIGAQADARWLRAIATVPSSGRPGVDALVGQVARADEGALAALQRVPEACPDDPACATAALGALEGYYLGATRPNDIAWLAPLRELEADPALLYAVLEVASSEAEPPAAVASMEASCAPGDAACSADRRDALVAWYRHLGRPLAAAAVPAVASVPGRPDVSRALQAVLATGLPPNEAATRVADACPATDAGCRRDAVWSLAEAYDRIGRSADANAARTQK